MMGVTRVPEPPTSTTRPVCRPCAKGRQHGRRGDEHRRSVELLEEQFHHLGALLQPKTFVGIGRPGCLDGCCRRRRIGIGILVSIFNLMPPIARVTGIDGQQRVDALALLLGITATAATSGGMLPPVPNSEGRKGIGPRRLVGVPVGNDAAGSQIIVGMAAAARPGPVEYGNNVVFFLIGQEGRWYPQRRSWAGGMLVLAFVAPVGVAFVSAARQSPARDDRLGTILPAVSEATRRVTDVAHEGTRLVTAVHLS